MNSRKRRHIVLPGGSGQVGQLLARHFHALGDDVTVLARHATTGPWKTVAWDGLRAGEWVSALDGADVVINLAGRSVNCRYNEKNRREMMESRVLSTRVLGEAITSVQTPPRLWMNSSTATIYRHALDRAMDEATGELGGNEPGAPSTWNFSIDVAKSWEREFFAAEVPGVRRVALRSAMIMDPSRGGIFDTLLRLVRLGLGGTAASGEQYISWVHGQDFVRAIEFLIAHEEMDGAVNIAAPNPLPNREFMRILRRTWGAPIGLPATKWMLEIGAMLMGSETELILKSRRVVAGRLRDAGFEFQFPQWVDAARELVDRWKSEATAKR
jgi:uncharacterized protein (TIGR01777 family)